MVCALTVTAALVASGSAAGRGVGETAVGTEILFPIAGHTIGAGGTIWDTDIRLLNRSGMTTNVTLDFFPAGEIGNDAPARSRTLLLSVGEHLVLNGWANIFPGAPQGLGAIRVTSDLAIIGVARIYNDQRSVGGGTFGQFVGGYSAAAARSFGTFPMLSNQHTQLGVSGFRTNIGWFNNSPNVSTVTFRAHVLGGTHGAVVATATRTVLPYSQMQLPLNQLFPAHLEPYEHLYVTFETVGAPLHVYASVVDNVTADPILIPVQ
jgi:hypothetical protein